MKRPVLMAYRKTSLLLALCLLLLGAAPTASAAGMSATVATGPVVLNGQAVDNATAEYPLLVYKDITYFPMTYHLCRFFGPDHGLGLRHEDLLHHQDRRDRPVCTRHRAQP